MCLANGMRVIRSSWLITEKSAKRSMWNQCNLWRIPVNKIILYTSVTCTEFIHLYCSFTFSIASNYSCIYSSVWTVIWLESTAFSLLCNVQSLRFIFFFKGNNTVTFSEIIFLLLVTGQLKYYINLIVFLLNFLSSFV